MSLSPSQKRPAQELDARLRELYRATLREPVPACLLDTVDQLEANARADRAA
jgi:hypothetical protein